MIHRTLHHIYAIVVDDSKGHTLVAASTREKDVADGLASLTNVDAAEARRRSDRARRPKRPASTRVVFDTRRLASITAASRALADAARDAGLEF